MLLRYSAPGWSVFVRYVPGKKTPVVVVVAPQCLATRPATLNGKRNPYFSSIRRFSNRLLSGILRKGFSVSHFFIIPTWIAVKCDWSIRSTFDFVLFAKNTRAFHKLENLTRGSQAVEEAIHLVVNDGSSHHSCPHQMQFLDLRWNSSPNRFQVNRNAFVPKMMELLWNAVFYQLLLLVCPLRLSLPPPKWKMTNLHWKPMMRWWKWKW